MRAFIALELPQTTILRLQREIADLRGACGRASWVRPEHMHLTLRFLGEISEEQKSALSQSMRQLCTGVPPMRLAVEGLGAFPNTRRPAVVWAGIRQVAGDLSVLQNGVERVARELGLDPDDKPFHPHVTLARIRDVSASAGLVAMVHHRVLAAPAAYGDEFRARAVALFRSDLKPGGPVYTRIEEFSL